jgi:hypothetical protein
LDGGLAAYFAQIYGFYRIQSEVSGFLVLLREQHFRE